MANDQLPKYVNQLEQDSHDNSANVTVKRVGLQGWNSTTLQWERLGSTGGLLTPSAFTVQIDYASGSSPVYVGIVVPGTATAAAAWQIKKITYDANGNPITIQYAGGTPTFTQVWDNRTSLSYS